MTNNESKRTQRIILFLSIVFLLLSGYYFNKPDPKHICHSGCENHFNFVINPLKGFRTEPPIIDKLPQPPLEEVADQKMCPQVCFQARHPLSYLYFDIAIILSTIRGILIITSKPNKHESV